MDKEGNHFRVKNPAPKKKLRILPGVVIILLLVVFRYLMPLMFPGIAEIRNISFMSGIVGGLAVVLWWLFFSKAPLADRFMAIIVMTAALAGIYQLTHVSIKTGMMGLMYFFMAIPLLGIVFVLWAALTAGLSDITRRATMVPVILLACSVWTLLRSEGIAAMGTPDLAWRWSKTSEQQVFDKLSDEQVMVLTTSESTAMKADWPGFRGAARDGIIRDIQIGTEWSKQPPVILWKRAVGSGCSSFAVKGNRIYTQEQRDEDELVTCYDLLTGKLVWAHSDKARFWDSHAGSGPRATPTVVDGRVYTFGATGILNVLDAEKGTLIWSRNAAFDISIKAPDWGFCSSPLVYSDKVIVAVEGVLACYDSATGQPVWFGSDNSKSYSSPHLAVIDGVTQILLVRGKSLISVLPEDGRLLWEYQINDDTSILQPVLADGNDLLVSGEASGIRRITVARKNGSWIIKEQWYSRKLKPNFNDFVLHKGNIYGYDGDILTCIDGKNGERMWKAGREGRYGGQFILLADQDLLVVVTEKGNLALVKAEVTGFTEMGRIEAIEGKTWNHPALAGNILLVRNTREMAAFRLM